MLRDKKLQARAVGCTSQIVKPVWCAGESLLGLGSIDKFTDDVMAILGDREDSFSSVIDNLRWKGWKNISNESAMINTFISAGFVVRYYLKDNRTLHMTTVSVL